MHMQGLVIQYPGLKPQCFTWAVAVVDRGGLKHLVDRFGNWVQTVFSERATISSPQEHLINNYLNPHDY